MDVVFHGLSGALLVHTLGERRPVRLALGALAGVVPDLPNVIASLLGRAWLPYGLTHSLLLNGAGCLLLAALDWRLALSWALHLAVDMPLHTYSELYRVLPVQGVNWYEPQGRAIWGGLWFLLAALLTVRVAFWVRARLARSRGRED